MELTGLLQIAPFQGMKEEELVALLFGLPNSLKHFEGKELTVEEIGAPNLLASAFIFATENRFPVNVEAIGLCEVFIIGKERFLEFMRLHPLMMQNFLKDISDRSVFLSRKLNEFALLNLKTRLLNYLETHSVIHNQQEVAQKLGVTRPSLARALSELVNEGKIKK